MNRSVIFIIIIIMLSPLASLAMQESRPLPSDHRLRVMTYSPNSMHHYVGYYGYEASIVLEEGEKVQTLAVGGDPSTWQIVPSGSRIFIKPIADNPEDAKMNALMITNKRTYYLIIEAAEVGPLGMDDPNLVFETRFVYPDATGTDLVKKISSSDADIPDLSEPGKYNFNYTISGSELLAPMRVFDDGEFTYIQFNKKVTEVPAIFMVDTEGKEALINFRSVRDYIIIERVTSQFTLRNGNDAACIFNESRPLKKIKK
jgi:type IV secretion system protein VirB9